MGKKRGGKKGAKPGKNFKVVGAKSLKVKTKAKPVKSDLKKLSKAANKQKLKEVDEQLVTLQDKVVKKPEAKKAAPRAAAKKGKNKKGKQGRGKAAQDASAAADKIEKLEV